ncbi:MAG: hypothetical protein ACYDCK_13280 [Thermoplasmatota archaeon]
MSDALLARVARPFTRNPRHFVRMRVAGREIRFDTRVTGMTLGILAWIPLALRFPSLAAGASVALVLALLLPDSIYWAATRAWPRMNSNDVRLALAFVAGVGLAVDGQAAFPWGLKIAIPAGFLASVTVAHFALGYSEERGSAR